MTREQAAARIKAILQRYVVGTDSAAFDILPRKLTSGKLYEAYAVGLIARELARQEGFELRLMNASYLPLKTSPGPINRRYPHIAIRRFGQCVAELWTDIEFLSLSYAIRRSSTPPEPGEYHELDIAIVDPGLTGRPPHSSVWLAAECKNTGYEKALLKEVLGIRRELSLLQGPRPTRFSCWPRTTVPAEPPSCVLVYTTDSVVGRYSRPGETFGIDFFHEPLSL